ncbi:hypothetical protein AB204_13045 [Xenorhabdus khoisanae]|uniref:Uncharacterized protein n=1 Tax=Xenorhabdus khoisanae TaxID=880157 RepID=A0A0J5FQW4_9GAMM|nr:hypothetical protein [Xenorhabdus khoisanae]KMJ44696.1 hypothetical protein AB204_13045 [Xenorhabdus khoisanae]
MTNKDAIREVFEKFLLTEFRFFENALEKDGDGTYFNMSAQNYWEVFQAGWKASRENIEIELPKSHTMSEFSEQRNHPDIQERMIARDETLEECWNFIAQQGFEVKESQK